MSDRFDATLALGRLSVPLQDGYIAATCDADDPDGPVTGLIRGYGKIPRSMYARWMRSSPMQ